jgi:hypothetical protein
MRLTSFISLTVHAQTSTAYCVASTQMTSTRPSCSSSIYPVSLLIEDAAKMEQSEFDRVISTSWHRPSSNDIAAASLSASSWTQLHRMVVNAIEPVLVVISRAM